MKTPLSLEQKLKWDNGQCGFPVCIFTVCIWGETIIAIWGWHSLVEDPHGFQALWAPEVPKAGALFVL